MSGEKRARVSHDPGSADETVKKQPESYSGVGLRVDIPLERWPAVEQSAAIVIVGDRERTLARKFIRRFVGRARLKQLLKALPGKWLIVTLTHGGMMAGSTSSVAGLIDLHRRVLASAQVLPGHVELYHFLDAETRAAVVADSKQFDLSLAETKGAA
jgi:hypothetical protein